ncbi:N-acyl-D-amino-acid deacylase family protein [Sphingomonas bacterium]|uniref:N-acyl-D-amino-acid deacylase family protein n=1 Tax=Sphingomonas bacterium TaxID=1895847 RepID=UPI0015757798|nr:amidohydrolase family protein [Sphingomonas bacterium]
MHDLVIRGGRIADGSGSDAFTGDVAIKDGVIVQVGGQAGPAADEIDADGALVTPGFVDVHSHYDGQATWDDTMDPSFSNGITTTMMGMCGVGFAPVRPQDRDLIIAVMEGVEAIPGIVLAEGVPWKWQSFPEYMDFLDKRKFGVDLGVLAPHAPMRVFTMGDRAVTHQAATSDDLAVMTDLVREAMDVGAFGISAGRITDHIYGAERNNPPGTFAEHEEFFALSAAMAESGRGRFQIVPRGAAGATPYSPVLTREERVAEHRLIEDIARHSGRPVHYLLQQFDSDADDWRMMLDMTHDANAAGLPVYAHIASRGFGLISMLDGFHNFAARPSYLEIAALPLAERVRAMREDSRRDAILSEANLGVETIGQDAANGVMMMEALGGRGYLFGPGNSEYEPTPDRMAEALAAARGLPLERVLYDHLTADTGGNSVVHLLINYSNGNLDHVRTMLQDPTTISSLGDGGAHMKLISDASMLPFHLSFWARDRKRGPRLRLEDMVARITGLNARCFGLDDRGLLKTGLKADVNVIDFDGMALGAPKITHDLPAGGARLNQATSGFLATVLSGTVSRRNDQDTGERPGRLMRDGQPRATSSMKETRAYASA